MADGAADYLLYFYANIDTFILMFVRILGFLILMPILAGNTVPLVVKIGFAVFLSIIVYSGGGVAVGEYEQNVFSYVMLLVNEFMVGFIIAFVVYSMFSVMFFVGQIVDYQIGFSMVSVFDPVSQMQVPITGNLYYFLLCALFVVSDGLGLVIFIVAKSFITLPLGKAAILNNAGLMANLLDILVRYMAVGVQISLPVLGTIMVVDIALGVLTKAVPQMNVYVVGMPIKVFIGLGVLWLSMPVMLNIYEVIIDDIMFFTEGILKGMMP